LWGWDEEKKAGDDGGDGAKPDKFADKGNDVDVGFGKDLLADGVKEDGVGDNSTAKANGDS